jgi:hypothetical protein
MISNLLLDKTIPVKPPTVNKKIKPKDQSVETVNLNSLP